MRQINDQRGAMKGPVFNLINFHERVKCFSSFNRFTDQICRYKNDAFP